MTLTRAMTYHDGGDLLHLPPGTECRYLTAQEGQHAPGGPGDPQVVRLGRPGLVWVWLAGKPRRVPQEALSDWRPIRPPRGSRGYQRPGHAHDVSPWGPGCS